jgi:hypothetical protein
MLSDRERVKLRVIEQQLQQEDQRLALPWAALDGRGCPDWPTT